MFMNTIKPYYIVKTTLTYTFFMRNIAESYPPPKKKIPQPLGHLTFLVGPGTHFYQNQLKFASFRAFAWQFITLPQRCASSTIRNKSRLYSINMFQIRHFKKLFCDLLTCNCILRSSIYMI